MVLCVRLLGHTFLIGALALIFLQSSFAQDQKAAAETAASVAARRQQLLSLFDEQWEYEMRTNPEWATTLGDKRYNDRLSDNSPEFFQSDLEQARKFLARFEAIDPTGIPHQDGLSRELMIRELRRDIEGAHFKEWEMPVNQMDGPHLELPDTVTLTPTTRTNLREAILAAINDQILPAYHRFAVFVRDDYAPHGRTDPGIWSLPDGEARYRYSG